MELAVLRGLGKDRLDFKTDRTKGTIGAGTCPTSKEDVGRTEKTACNGIGN